MTLLNSARGNTHLSWSQVDKKTCRTERSISKQVRRGRRPTPISRVRMGVFIGTCPSPFPRCPLQRTTRENIENLSADHKFTNSGIYNEYRNLRQHCALLKPPLPLVPGNPTRKSQLSTQIFSHHSCLSLRSSSVNPKSVYPLVKSHLRYASVKWGHVPVATMQHTHMPCTATLCIVQVTPSIRLQTSHRFCHAQSCKSVAQFTLLRCAAHCTRAIDNHAMHRRSSQAKRNT